MLTPTSSTRGSFHRWITPSLPRDKDAVVRYGVAIAGLVLGCVVAGAEGIRVTRDLQWPPGQDLSRDIAAAESIRHGHPLSDPAYEDEWLWYNPLVPAIVAGASSVVNVPIHTVYTRLGAYANLIAPIGLFVLLAVLFDAWVALFAVVGLLFLVPAREPAWLCATYSPWLLPVHFVQGLFYFALLAVWLAWRKSTVRAACLAAALAGLVLLGHTAPFLILTATIGIGVLLTLATGLAHGAGVHSSSVRLSSLLWFALITSIVSAPYLASILGHYHANVLNGSPSSWVPSELSAEGLPRYLRYLLTPTTVGLVAAVGLIGLMTRLRRKENQLILTAAASALLWFIYSCVVVYAGRSGWHLPPIVPSFHFLYYVRAFESVLFGLGVAEVVRIAVRVTRRLDSSAAYALASVVLLIWVGTRIDDYRSRSDLVDQRAAALTTFKDPDLFALYQFIRNSTAPSDVFLSADNVGLSVVAVAGRKVVALDRFFSNPFVDWARRSRDRDQMQALLADGDGPGFMALASRYHVRYVTTIGSLQEESALTGCCLTRLWQSHDWFVYRINGDRNTRLLRN
jgi:hypothetical protein